MTPAPRLPQLTRVLLVGVAAGLAASTLTACALVGAVTSHEREAVFATWAEAPRATVSAPNTAGGGDFAAASDPDPRFVPPAFVPDDATMIRMRIDTAGPGALVRYESTTAIDPAACAPGPLVGSALLDTTWWPIEVPADGLVCESGWQVFDQDGASFGWLSK